MGILDFLKNIFSNSKGNNKLINIYVQDEKCGNKLKIVLRKGYDIVQEYDKSKDAKFYCKKVAVCDNCYNKINMELYFDRSHNIKSSNLTGGKMITKEEFDSEQKKE